MERQVVFGLRSAKQTRAFRKLNRDIVVVGFLSPSGWGLVAPKRYDFSGFFEAGGDIARLWESDVDADHLEEARGEDRARPVWITPRLRPEPTGQIDYDRQAALMRGGFDAVLVNDPESAIESRCRYFRGTDQPHRKP
jgi:hypothetical protein